MAPQTISQNLVPVIVGIVSLMFFDNSLGNLQAVNVNELFKHPLPRSIALFGAAYGANGGRLYQALIAFIIYAFIEHQKVVFETLGLDIFKVPFNIIESDTNTTPKAPTATPTSSTPTPTSTSSTPTPTFTSSTSTATPTSSTPTPTSTPSTTPTTTSENVAATRSYAEIPITSTFLRPAFSRNV